jgi:hypothetical protein
MAMPIALRHAARAAIAGQSAEIAESKKADEIDKGRSRSADTKRIRPIPRRVDIARRNRRGSRGIEKGADFILGSQSLPVSWAPGRNQFEPEDQSPSPELQSNAERRIAWQGNFIGRR